MKLFHGSTISVNNPVILKSQRLDFGKGFYTTTNQNQAERWAIIKKKRFGNNTKSIVTTYELSKKIFLNQKYKIEKFTTPNEEWLDFVYTNRKEDKSLNYDIVIGPVANDTLYATLSLYEANLLTKQETIKRLKVHQLYDQISFHNKTILTELSFFDSYEI